MTTTPEPSTQVGQRICPGCEAEPPADLTSPICPACGSRLVELKPPTDALIGQVVDGRFEIRDRLGEGGMGTVYRAWQRSIGREVAIKIIDHRHIRDGMAVRRFLREARLSSQLSQPNTVSVFDFGQADDGRLFIAMELIRGKTLGDLVKAEGRLSVARAARIGVQLCDALDAAHRLQIVHRDLKPSNVIVLDDPPGRDLIKVLDFGLAKSMTDDETESTQTGFVVGTPRYMAPEVALGSEPSPQSDLYAVGVLLGEITTGKKMWDISTFSALVAAKNRGTPIRADIPPGIRGLVDRLIDPDPARRPARASELRPLLQLLTEDTESPAVTAELDAPTSDGLFDVEVATPAPRPRVTAPTVNQRGPRDGDPDPDPEPEPEPAPAVEPPATRALDTPGTGTSPVTSLSMRVQRSRVSAAALGVGLVVVIGVVAGIVLTRGGGDGKTVDAAVAVSAPPADAAPAIIQVDAGAAEAPRVDEITLHVTSKPSGATITIDGRNVGVTPRDVRVARGPTAVTIEVAAKGRVTWRRDVVPDRDRKVDATLSRVRATSGTGAGTDDTPF